MIADHTCSGSQQSLVIVALKFALWQVSALQEGNSNLMDAYVKEESKEGHEIDPEM